MKFKCLQSTLITAVQNAAKAASAKSTIPALEGILFSVQNGELTLTGYDLDLGIQTSLAVNESENGGIVLNARLISDIIRKMPNSEISFEVTENLMVNLYGGEAEFSILGMEISDYPNVPQINPQTSFKIPQKELKSMIGQTLFAVAATDLKPVHMGSKFDLKDNMLSIVSVDGVRMALRKEKIEFDDISFVVPGKALGEIFRMLDETSENDAVLCVERNQISFEIGSYIIISRLLEGDFINYRNAMSFETDIIAEVNVRELADSLERTLLLINEKHKSPVRLEFKDEWLSVSCTTALGKINDKIRVSYNGNPLVIGVNAKYLLEAIKHSESDMVRIMLSGSLSPIKILPKDGDSFIFLVLPIRMKGE